MDLRIFNILKIKRYLQENIVLTVAWRESSGSLENRKIRVVKVKKTMQLLKPIKKKKWRNDWDLSQSLEGFSCHLNTSSGYLKTLLKRTAFSRDGFCFCDIVETAKLTSQLLFQPPFFWRGGGWRVGWPKDIVYSFYCSYLQKLCLKILFVLYHKSLKFQISLQSR